MLQKKNVSFYVVGTATLHVRHALRELLLLRELNPRQQQRGNKPVGDEEISECFEKVSFPSPPIPIRLPLSPSPATAGRVSLLNATVQKKNVSFYAVGTDTTCTARFVRSFKAPQRRHSTATAGQQTSRGQRNRRMLRQSVFSVSANSNPSSPVSLPPPPTWLHS